MSQQADRADVVAPDNVLLIESELGITATLASVHHCYLSELRKLSGLTLHHRDLAVARGDGPPSASAAADLLGAPTVPPTEPVTCVYRIGVPIRAGAAEDQRRTVTFMVADLGLHAGSFAPGDARSDFFTRDDNLIVTPSEWSRQRLIAHGYPARKVAVVPLAVDATTFTPQGTPERARHREQMGFHPDETVFVHAGVPRWTTGVDVLLRAFAALRSRGRRVRLILNDEDDGDGASLKRIIRDLGGECPELLRAETLAAIGVLSGTLTDARMRALLGAADAYAAPSRAEGFNLTVLKAIACGTPVIVTRGGATDDVCDDDVAWRVPGEDRAHADPATGAPGRFIEPDLDALIATMDAVVGGDRSPSARFDAARRDILARFTWRNTAARLAFLTVGLDVANADAQPRDARAHVRSFDVFDTLIARRCLEPWRVFEQVGAKIGRPDFPRARITAESQLAGQDYTLTTIYEQLASLWDLTPDQAHALMAEEIATEIDNVVPIQENLARVRHGDLLVSDMYMPESVIRDLLAAAGLDKRVGLVVSTQGKRQGHIWPKIAPHVAITRHLGDNKISDVEMATRSGIDAEHTDVSAPTLVESWLTQQGLPSLALFAREARLRTWHEDPAFRNLQKIQAQINLPILLLSSIQLSRVARETKADRLLFCSRDCDLWLELYRALKPRIGPDIDISYFYTSRISRMTASADYLTYTRDLLGDRGLIVDACGTGWSLAHLIKALGMTRRDVFFIHKCYPLNVYEEHAPTPETCAIHTVINPDRYIPNIGIEMVNTAEHGSVVDVRIIANTPIPLLGKEWESARVRAAIAVQRKAFLSALTGLERLNVDELLGLSADKIASVTQALYEHLHVQPELREVFLAEYRRETVDVHGALRIPLA